MNGLARDQFMDLAQQHHEALRQYTASYVLSQKNSRQSSQRASAREKLTRLTKLQFEELSTNVYDEMRRRVVNSPEVPFLPVNPDYHPKRNQARQKLATLPTARFKDLAVDIYLEIERRYPHLVAQYVAKYGNDVAGPPPPRGPPQSAGILDEMGPRGNIPYPKSPPPTGPSPRPQMQNGGMRPFQSPEKRGDVYGNEPLYNNAGGGPPSPNLASIDMLMADLGSIINEDASSAEKIKKYEQRLEILQSNLRLAEGKLQQAEEEARQLSYRVKELENERSAMGSINEKSRQLEDRLEDSLRELEDSRRAHKEKDDKLRRLDEDYRKLRSDYESLEKDFKGVQDDYTQQTEIVTAIRGEATNLLNEVRSTGKLNDELKNERDQLLSRVKELEEQLNDTRRDAQNARSRSIVQSRLPPPGNDRIESAYDGFIDRGRIAAYHSAIDDLLRSSRSEQPTAVLVAMKAIVLACKNITEETDAIESRLNNSGPPLPTDTRDRITAVKAKLSSALTSVMGSAKAMATNSPGSNGGSLIQQVELSTRNLTATINELLRQLKRAGSGGDDTRARSRERGDMRERSRSRDWDREQRDRQQRYPADEEDMEMDELKVFLERQTDQIVQAIQVLLMAMRQTTQLDPPEVSRTIGGITGIVDNLVRKTRSTLSRDTGESRGRAEGVLRELGNSNMRLEQLGREMVENPGSKALKQKLASSSYEIAKHVKELVSLID
ncbi:hypothetical protein BJ742DRAFT_152785 [Cladochytrium replicatum]|nr:hypothetical protein BJ742DRAFT_152785 [Cladochytrium replicatum]